MDKERLKQLGIDPNLPLRRVLELLQDKNIELLERLDNCSDPQRAKELERQQKEVEDAIGTLSTGVTLDRMARQQIQTQAAASPQQAQPDPYAQSVMDYQAGNLDKALPVLEEYAKKGDLLACMVVGNHLLGTTRAEDGKRYLYSAAQTGDGTAALMLARQFLREGNTISAKKWGQAALDKKIPGSGAVVSAALAQEKQYLEAVDPLITELDCTTGYDRFCVTRDLCALLNNANISNAQRAKHLKPIMDKLKGDSRCSEYVEGKFKRASYDSNTGVIGVILIVVLTFLAGYAGQFISINFGHYSRFDLGWVWFASYIPWVVAGLVIHFVLLARSHGKNSEFLGGFLLILPLVLALPMWLLFLLLRSFLGDSIAISIYTYLMAFLHVIFGVVLATIKY